ncbi:MAG: SDR family oxidoreductase [Ruminococcus sp.]|nr:SDR family oxidoreductase [Ruminococcus sp.]
MKLDKKVALVTGGAMGIGKGIVRVFLKHGATVVILDNSEEVSKTINELNSEFPGKINGYVADIRKEDVLIACYNEIEKTYNHLDIIVNNAGVCKLVEFESMSNEERDFHFDININGTWNVTKIFLPLLKKSQAGAIVNMSSVTGPMVADPGEVAYATSKGAVLAFTKSLARELVKYNIRVNAIMPGYVNTPMVNNMAGLTDPNNPSGVITGIANAIPMKRLANPEEIGELAAFLASSEASYITAQGIVIDGASTLPETMTMGV